MACARDRVCRPYEGMRIPGAGKAAQNSRTSLGLYQL